MRVSRAALSEIVPAGGPLQTRASLELLRTIDHGRKQATPASATDAPASAVTAPSWPLACIMVHSPVPLAGRAENVNHKHIGTRKERNRSAHDAPTLRCSGLQPETLSKLDEFYFALGC